MANKQLALRYSYNPKPSALLNSIFMSTVNTAAKTLVSVASTAKNEGSGEKWKATDHIRFMFMLTTWLAVWALRVLMDNLPFSIMNSNNRYFDDISHVGAFDLVPSLTSALSSSLALFSSATGSATAGSTSSALSVLSGSGLDLMLSEEYGSGSTKALQRGLTNVLAMLNEIPASSRKYQFAVSMADRIVDENARCGHVELLEINRVALSSAFARTQGLLYRTLKSSQKPQDNSGWMIRTVKAFPFGSYAAFFMKGVGAFFPAVGSVFALTGTNAYRSNKQKQLATINAWEEREDEVAAEKHAQELLWLTNKMRMCGVVDEALAHWSTASELASIALTANPRVQGFIVKITAILLGELRQVIRETPRQVKFRILAIWLPLFCYAENGLTYPIMSSYEKKEMERIMDEIISSLPTIDQEVILSNWLQDFTICSSDWPNLQASYERWCHSTRTLIM